MELISQIHWRKVGEKFVICKRGVYFSLTESELVNLKLIINDIESGTQEFYQEDARINRSK